MEELNRLDGILALMFPGKYRSVGYEFATNSDGNIFGTYRCYVEGYPYGTGNTIPEAFLDMIKDGEGPR